MSPIRITTERGNVCEEMRARGEHLKSLAHKLAGADNDPMSFQDVRLTFRAVLKDAINYLDQPPVFP